MEKKNHIGKGIFALLVAAATLAGCSKDSDSNDNPTPPVVQDPYKEWPIKPKIKEGETSYISFYIPTGEDSSTDFYIKGNGWMDLNNNGVQDPDEKTEVFDGSEKSYTIKSQVCTLYGIISSFSISAGFGMKGLDVSHAPALQELLVSEQELSELNLKENKALSRLVMHSNYIKKLDLRKNKMLTVLDATSNALEELDLTENEFLTELQLGENKIKKLNLSKNKFLTELGASENLLSELDLKVNTKLTTLFLSDNQITNLDLKGQKELKQLYVNGNQLSTLNLNSENKLKLVNLVSNKLSEEAMLKIAENLPQREEADKGIIFLQIFRIVDGKQVVENNKLNKEILEKLDAKKWETLFFNKENSARNYNGNPNTPHENP